jgi:hypothetical protein
MRTRLVCLFLLAAVLLAATPLQPALAARGTPGSSEFGYGAHLNLSGLFAVDGVHLASDLQLDWLAIDLSWQSVSPKQGATDWGHLDPALQAAIHSQQPVMISLSNAPDWVQTPQGPDPNMVAQWVGQLVQRYADGVQAIELFPGANTLAGWGRQPNPQAYLKVIKAVQVALQKVKSPVLLVAGGVEPVLAGTDKSQAMDDLAFLQALYAGGLKSIANIISFQASNLTGEPLQASDASENRVLRHYEDIRAVMLQNKHETGLIWITHLEPPTGQIAESDQPYRNPDNQSNWLNQAYGQLKSQLYIGVSFLNGINPISTDATTLSLIQPGGDYHPFYRTLRDLVAFNRSDSPYHRPGRAKEQPLPKSSK